MTHYRRFLLGTRTLGNSSGSLNLATLRAFPSAFESLDFVISASVMGVTTQPSSRKYCVILA